MATTQHGVSSTNEGSDPIFEVENLNVTFDMDRGRSGVVNDVDLTVERGEILGVVGESGSGKSMLASALLDAVVDPGVTTGDVTYYPPDGDPADVLEISNEELQQIRWEEVSMVFQGAMSSFNPTLRIGSHFRETLSVHDYPIEEGLERGRELLEELYLDPDLVLDSYPHELSGGMKQRALIALSLVLEPEAVIMDEPTAALDLLMQRAIIQLLDRLQDEHDLTLVFITHDLDIVAEFADRLGVMYAFELVELGRAEDIVYDSHHPYTRALINSTPNIDTPTDLMRPIEGDSPDPVNVPTGCSYHPRCPMADDRCEVEDPDLVPVSENHRSACFFADQVENEIPLALDEVEYNE